MIINLNWVTIFDDLERDVLFTVGKDTIVDEMNFLKINNPYHFFNDFDHEVVISIFVIVSKNEEKIKIIVK